jgi:hypothetical protein
MDDSRLGYEERQRIRLRSGIARVERGLTDVAAEHAAGGTGAVAVLQTSWNDLVALLAVPDEPARRDCPFCGGPIVREATRCVHCWKKSSAPATDGRSPS